jgi:hypothetical protein
MQYNQFALESDTVIARIQDEHLLSVTMKSFDSKTKEKIRGTLSLQIIVDLYGRSCLISLKNNTNIKTKHFNLKKYIDEELKWEIPHTKVAALVVYRFDDNEIKVKRLGMNTKRGVHELRQF